MFTPIIDHPATTGAGRVGGYVPQGASPFAPEPHVCNQGGVCVLHNGDPVRVESAWDRGDGFVLLYARSVVTQEATHIPEGDYLAIDRIIVGACGQPEPWDPSRRDRDTREELEISA